MWSPHDGLSIPTDLLPQSWGVGRGRPDIPTSHEMSVRQQFANDKLGRMLTLPLALCWWQPVNVREVTCSASPWMWQVARVTLVKCCTPSILQILIDRIKLWAAAVLPWESTYVWMPGDKEVKCFITDECCMCSFFSKSIIGKYSFPELRIQLLLIEESLWKGVKYTLSRHFALQWILLFTTYYGLNTNYRIQSKSGCPAPSATGNSENFFTW